MYTCFHEFVAMPCIRALQTQHSGDARLNLTSLELCYAFSKRTVAADANTFCGQGGAQ